MSTSDAPFSRDGSHPPMGSFLYDKRQAKVGKVVEVGYRVTLRPEGGGREWEPEWENLRNATQADVLASRVRGVNRRAGAHRAVTHPEIRALGSARDPDT